LIDNLFIELTKRYLSFLKIILLWNYEKNHRDTFIGERINEDQAMPFMLPNGKQTNFVDMKTFLYETPYTCSANEKY